MKIFPVKLWDWPSRKEIFWRSATKMILNGGRYVHDHTTHITCCWYCAYIYMYMYLTILTLACTHIVFPHNPAPLKYIVVCFCQLIPINATLEISLHTCTYVHMQYTCIHLLKLCAYVHMLNSVDAALKLSPRQTGLWNIIISPQWDFQETRKFIRGLTKLLPPDTDHELYCIYVYVHVVIMCIWECMQKFSNRAYTIWYRAHTTLTTFSLFRWKLNTQNILCNICWPIPILVAKVWQWNLDYAKNLQAKYLLAKISWSSVWKKLPIQCSTV